MPKIKTNPFTNYKGQHFVSATAVFKGHNYGEFGRTAASARKKMARTLRMVKREHRRKR